MVDTKLTRTFICIDFSDDVIKEIARVQEIIENKPFVGKFSELENLHLTLEFLGEINETKIKEICAKLKEIKFNKFEAKLGEVGIFHAGKLHLPKIIWIKVNSKELWQLQKIICEKLKELFPFQEKFKAHTTIARVKYIKDKEGFENYIGKIKVKELKFDVGCFKLKSSELRTSGPIYRDIEIYSLEEKVF